MSRISSGITLIELIIALVLLFVIVLGLSSINIFSHFHVLNSDRRAKIQNEASLVLEHMNKEIKSAIGNEKIDGADSVVKRQDVSGDYAIWFYVDDGNPPNGQRDTIDDHWIVYRFTAASINPADRYQVWYCPQCANAPCTQCNPAWGSEMIARNIKAFIPTKHKNAIGQLDENSVTVQIVACWDPQTADLLNPNGTPDNPCVGMNASFQMPSVSVN